MAKTIGVLLLSIFISVALVMPALSASVEEFYQGKNIQFVVGGSAGGGYDTYTRLIARHFAQYVPGKPSVVVQNMPGAGMVIAANYIFNSAPRDGTTIGHWSGPLILQHLMGNRAVKFEGRKFGWLGMPTPDSLVCILTERSGIKTAEEWRKSKMPVKLGAIGAGTSGTDDTKLLAAATDFPLQLVQGYKGRHKSGSGTRGSRRYLRLWLAIGQGDLGQRAARPAGPCRAADDARRSSGTERCPPRG
jgi:tripartite-type tricarboxylate transporter receptor subunit TctC